jgi:glutamate racemase
MIGVFDSGVGGLTVLNELRRQMPRRDFLYLADTARFPYGSKRPQTVQGFVREAIDFLCDEGVEAIVLACNTASAAALPGVKAACGVSIWGMVDAGVEAATRATYNGHVAVIATEGTIASGVFQRKLQSRGLQVWAQACPALAEAVEGGTGDAEELARHCLREMPRADTLLLGCTHFARVRGTIERVAGPRVRVVDGAAVLARGVAEELEDEGSGRVRYYVTGGAGAFAGRLNACPTGLVQQVSLTEISRGVEIVHVD